MPTCGDIGEEVSLGWGTLFPIIKVTEDSWKHEIVCNIIKYGDEMNEILVIWYLLLL